MKSFQKYRLYGRLRGRRSKNITNDQYHNLLQPFKNNNLNIDEKNILDIGSGVGENVFFLSKKKERNIFSCDKYIDGNIKIINNIKKNKLKNIFVYHANVHELLDQIFKKNFFTEIWILFPDPWPKKKHHKRRLLNISFLKKIHNYMKTGGNLYIATDSNSYLVSILLDIYTIKNFFIWENQTVEGWEYINNNLPKTKFYKKAVKSGRSPFFIKLKKL
tara:strand:+ start:11417 stop:12070 length:654 start_codon:yes stop_codon:yes gene_type:complete